MSAQQSQIIAAISGTTKAMLDSYSVAHGVTKARIVEDALLHHLNALKQLPADVVLPPRIVVSQRSGAALMRRLRKPRRPNKAITKLFDK